MNEAAPCIKEKFASRHAAQKRIDLHARRKRGVRNHVPKLHAYECRHPDCKGHGIWHLTSSRPPKPHKR